MCNPNRIASLLTAASVALVAATVLISVAAVLAGSWWTAAGNIFVMAAAAVLIGTAKALVDAAAIEAAKCTTPGPCKTAGDRLLGALVVLGVTLAGLLTAVVVAAFAASIAYFGIGVAIAVGVTAMLAGIALFAVSFSFLPDLDICLVTATGAPPSTAVSIQTGFGIAAAFVLATGGAAAFFAP